VYPSTRPLDSKGLLLNKQTTGDSNDLFSPSLELRCKCCFISPTSCIQRVALVWRKWSNGDYSQGYIEKITMRDQSASIFQGVMASTGRKYAG
jgi:hypothetical protein